MRPIAESEDLPQLCCLQFAPNSPLEHMSGSGTAHPINTLTYHSPAAELVNCNLRNMRLTYHF